MFRRRTASGAEPRRGVILLVVLFLLTLFAIVGLTFVFHADAEARAARAFRDGQFPATADAEPELLFSFFLGQLLYDLPDDGRGVYSALRGHSLGRNMFGLNYTLAPDDSLQLAVNDAPFSGVGKLPYNSPFPGLDNTKLINHTYHFADGFLLDPERYGPRLTGLKPTGAPDNRTPYLGGWNVNYTYPDLNNLFLAAMKAGAGNLRDGTSLPEGTLLMPSFHRPWLFGPMTDIPNFPPGNPGNANWTNREGKYLTLRPRPIDMGPGFPYPEDEGGDVKNLIGSPGYYDPFTGRMCQNDSVWIDLDAPVIKGKDGKKYKALFAPLILDLDNRINLNVHGNLRGVNFATHTSNQGWGPWEVNPGRVLNNTPPEWPSLFYGTGLGGRYGRDGWPHSPLPGNMAVGPPHRFFAPTDFDGSQEARFGAGSDPLWLPGTGTSLPFSCFPGPAAGYGNSSNTERTSHPLLFHPFRPNGPDRLLGLNNIEALLRHGDTGAEALSGELMRFCPKTFADPLDPQGSARRRRQVTLLSADPDRPGITPWLWPEHPDVYNRVNPRVLPSTFPVGFHPNRPSSLPIHPDSEYGLDGRTAPYVTGLRRLNLNRYLPSYPNPDSSGRITDLTGFAVAQRARQYLVGEIFDRFWRVTGVGNPYDPTMFAPPGMPGYDVSRWETMQKLAQLAVNIVDFIDADDYNTPFNWYGNYPRNPLGAWVYGTELPRVVLNEAYVEYANDPTDPGVTQAPPLAYRFKGNVWVELFNAFRDDPPLTAPYRNGVAQLEMPESSFGAGDNYGIYQVLLANLSNEPREPDNPVGDLRPSTILSRLATFSPEPTTNPPPLVDTRTIQPANTSPAFGSGYFGNAAQNQGFYLLGPSLDPASEKDPFPALGGGRPLATLQRSEMSFRVPAFQVGMQPSVVLQRLACPHLPPNPAPGFPLNPALPLNPYITADYIYRIFPHYAASIGVLGPNQPPPTVVHQRSSVGRKQPYAAHYTQRRPQQPTPPLPDQPQHSFFQHNVDSDVIGPNWRVPPPNYPPFDWLVHLDRPLISPIELVHVSAYKPQELLQQFLSPGSSMTPYGHRAPWFDEDIVGPYFSHRLYRTLEFFCTHNLSLGNDTARTTSVAGVSAGLNRAVQPQAMAGASSTGGFWQIDVGQSLIVDRGLASEEVIRVKAVGPLGQPRPTQFLADFLKSHNANFTLTPTLVSERVPGKINLNTVWDLETFEALCDGQRPNGFTTGGPSSTVATIFQQLKASRTDPRRTGNGETPGPDDKPFLSLTSGPLPTINDPRVYEGGLLRDTLLRASPGDNVPFLVDRTKRHPYQQYEMLNKIFNHVTTRSNVFAVWLTVGFFEVTDDTTRPVQLGAELGRAENRHIRHRMFAIVDRSVLHIHPGPQLNFDPRAARSPGARVGRAVPYLSIID